MSLSICLLTRNAAESLRCVLGSIAGMRAEVIVGDTGSTDDTVAIAQALGARVHEVDWQYDFASAQNQVLDQAGGEWVFWLNPDDELLPQGREGLPLLLARPDALAYVVRVQEVMNADRPEGAMETLAPRLFRRHPDFRYIGRLHPTFTEPIAEVARRHQQQILLADLVVRHHAYKSVLTRGKIRWATKLLELELQDRPGQLHYLIEYGRNLLQLNEPRGHAVLAEAADQVMAAQDSPLPPIANVASLLEYLLTVSPEQSQSRLSKAEAHELALRWFPNSPPLLWQLGQAAFAAENYHEAAGIMEKLINLGRSGAYDRSAAFDPTLMGEPALLNLGNCYLCLGDLDRAESCFGQVLPSKKHEARARQGYALVQAMRRRKAEPPEVAKEATAKVI